MPKRTKYGVQKGHKWPKEFSAERNKDLITFAKATGMRRSEVSGVKASDIYEKSGKLSIQVDKFYAKGGRPREAPVIEKYRPEVEKIIKDKSPDEKIFERIPVRSPIHKCRREYVQERYRKLIGRDYQSDHKNNQEKEQPGK